MYKSLRAIIAALHVVYKTLCYCTSHAHFYKSLIGDSLCLNKTTFTTFKTFFKVQRYIVYQDLDLGSRVADMLEHCNANSNHFNDDTRIN